MKLKHLGKNKLFLYGLGVVVLAVVVVANVVTSSGPLSKGSLGPSISCTGKQTGTTKGKVNIAWSAQVTGVNAYVVKWAGPEINGKTGDTVTGSYSVDQASKVNVQASLYELSQNDLGKSEQDTGKVTYCSMTQPAAKDSGRGGKATLNLK